MYRIVIMTILSLLFIILVSENPSSANYIMQQASFGSGSNPADPPSSENYILTGSIIGVISGDEATSTNYNILPGYYLGEITESSGIIPPENVTISILDSNVELSWTAVSGATSYKVYSSDEPDSGFIEDTTGTYVDETWTAPASSEKKFYYVKALN